jgi:hypothetical protein
MGIIGLTQKLEGLMKKKQQNVGFIQAAREWINALFYAPETQLMVQPRNTVATTHMRLFADASFQPNQSELVNDLIRKLQTIKVSPMAMMTIGLAFIQHANAQAMDHGANITFVGADGAHYRYLYGSSYPELTGCADQFKSGAAGVVVEALNFTASTVFYQGILVLPTQMIAMLEYHTGMNASAAQMQKIMDVVVPAIKQINDAAETSRNLKIGLPIAIIGFILLAASVALITRCLCRRRQMEYVDLAEETQVNDLTKPKDETSTLHNDL